jgi:hypothetical protein
VRAGAARRLRPRGWLFRSTAQVNDFAYSAPAVASRSSSGGSLLGRAANLVACAIVWGVLRTLIGLLAAGICSRTLSPPDKGAAPMRRTPRFRVLILALALALAACGAATRVLYDGAEPAVLLIANRHLALLGDQWKVASVAVGRFHVWHRRNELPRYATLLTDAAGRVRRGLTRSDVEWGLQSARARYAALVEAAVLQSTPLIEAFDAENVAALERRFAQEDAKRVREHLSGSPAKRERERVKAIVKRFEEWTGPLNESQAGLVGQFVAATADYPEYAHQLRRRRQRELVTLLDRAVREDSAAPVDALRALFIAWGLEKTPERRRRDERFVELLLELDRCLTPAQRARVVERLTRYAEDARVLARGA